MLQAFIDRVRRTGVILVFIAGALLLALTLPASKSLAQDKAAQEDLPMIEFPFLTLRNKTGSTEPGEAYGGERSDLKGGYCGVAARELGVLSPLADAVPSFMREELLRVEDAREAEPVTVLDGLEATAGAKGPVVYVHGYYISFEKGCRRAALLRQNAQLEGRFLWFSWPSDGSAASYTHDEADLYWSVPDLADTIIELDRRFGSGRVDVVGHSLGARGVVLALYEVANRRADIRLGHVALLAPDMDFEIFARILPRIAPVAKSLTVYVASNDKPLQLSRQLHGYARLGEAGNDLSKIAGVEVVDLSGLPGETPTGHLYHIYSSAVGADLSRLLNEGRLAAARSGLVSRGENHFLFKAAKEN